MSRELKREIELALGKVSGQKWRVRDCGNGGYTASCSWKFRKSDVDDLVVTRGFEWGEEVMWSSASPGDRQDVEITVDIYGKTSSQVQEEFLERWTRTSLDGLVDRVFA